MVTVHRESNWKIAVYARDHGIPHFHVEGPDFRCSVAIATGALIIGSAPTGVLEEATAWARQNREMLLAKWQEKWQELNG